MRQRQRDRERGGNVKSNVSQSAQEVSNAPKKNRATGLTNNERPMMIIIISLCIRRRANKSLRLLLIPAHFKDSTTSLISSRPGQPRSGGSCDLCCESPPAIVQLPHIASCLQRAHCEPPEGSEERLKTW